MIGLITGASRGLGFELVSLGLERGDSVIAGVRGPEEKSSNLMNLKSIYKEKLMILIMDVCDEQAVDGAARIVESQYGSIDYLVNNAGVLFESKYDLNDPMINLDIKMFRKTLEVNTIGPAIVLKYFMPLIYRSKKPCIINITSEAGHLSPGGYNYLAYSVSKHGLNMYTQKIKNYLSEAKDKGDVRIYMVHPGRMDTLMGSENAQMSPKDSAKGVIQIIDGTIDPQFEVPFINYLGEQMPY